MTLRELHRTVSLGEGESLEFKRKASHPDKIVKELVAFANTKGGYLLVGVSDDGSIPGLKFPDEEAFAIEQAIFKLCKPKFDFEKKIIAISEKRSVLSIYVPSSTRKPHFVLEHFRKRWGQAFIRVEDKSVKASREVREIIKKSKLERNIKFTYGNKEQQLMRYLEEHDSITLQRFKDLAGINTFTASNTLIRLVLANVLLVIPREKEDLYLRKSTT